MKLNDLNQGVEQTFEEAFQALATRKSEALEKAKEVAVKISQVILSGQTFDDTLNEEVITWLVEKPIEFRNLEASLDCEQIATFHNFKYEFFLVSILKVPGNGEMLGPEEVAKSPYPDPDVVTAQVLGSAKLDDIIKYLTHLRDNITNEAQFFDENFIPHRPQ